MRHERRTVAMALAEAQHHAAARRPKPASAITVNDAPRGQKNADAEYFELSSDEEVASARGMRPAPLSEPRPQERVQRHTMEQMIESFVPVPILDLDAPVPQMVEQLVGVLKVFDQSLPEQVIEVPFRLGSHTVLLFASRSWRNSWWKCRLRQGTNLRWLPCKPLWRAARALLEQVNAARPGRDTNTGHRDGG